MLGERAVTIVGDVDEERPDVHLDVVEPAGRRGGLGHDGDLVDHGLARVIVAMGLRADHPGVRGAVDADDVGLARGDRQHPLAATTDQDGWAGLWTGLGSPS